MSSAAHDRFEHVTRTLGPRVLGYLARRTAQPADAADLLADVLLIAWRRIDDVPADDEQAFAWLLGVARRVAANHGRGRRRRNALADRLRTALQHAAPVADGAEARLVGDALARLKAGDRELITLIAWEGLSPSEAARALGISPVAARKRLQRARERLRPMLDEATPAAPPPPAPRPIPETVERT